MYLYPCLINPLNPQRRKRREIDGSENVKRSNVKAGRGNGAGRRCNKQEHVEAVTLFEVVTMGKSAMQVRQPASSMDTRFDRF